MALRRAAPHAVPTRRGVVHQRDGRDMGYYAVEVPRAVAPRRAYLGLRDAQMPLLLESAAGRADIATQSVLVANPTDRFLAHGADRLLDRLHAWWECETGMREGDVPAPGPGVYGAVAYEGARAIERLPATTRDDLGLPLAAFGRYAAAAVWHRNATGCTVWARTEGTAAAAAALMVPLLDAVRGGGPDPDPASIRAGAARVASSHAWPAYAAMVERARAYIRAGDIFQANLAQRLVVPWPADAWSLYDRLMRINPSPFSVLADFGDWQLVSCSPERLARLRAGRVETRPIAGTRPRGRSAAEDAALRRELRVDPKECAEHVMIVDMARNDLGRVCEFGSVRPDSLAHLEAYSHVTHIVSNLAGRPRAGVGPWDLLRATFPGASVTGVPKVRCMEIIDELETVQRGMYTGSFGWLAPTGDCDWNILIRTITLHGGRAYLHVGGGIVAESDPAREYQETWAKAAALLGALGVAPPATEPTPAP